MAKPLKAPNVDSVYTFKSMTFQPIEKRIICRSY